MTRNKNRLYLALYLRSGPGYHWALYRCPKRERRGDWGTRYDAKEASIVGDDITWEYNEQVLDSGRAHNVLVRVLLAKIQDDKRFEAIIRDIQIRWGTEGWTCKAWVREALDKLHEGGALAPGAVVEWQTVHDNGLEYVERKKAEHRFDGKAPEGKFSDSKLPTFDLLRNKETTP